MIPRALKRLVNKRRKFYLQSRTFSNKDGLGNKIETWTNTQELKGTIQGSRSEKKGIEGTYDTATHKGLFETFEIEDMQSYRVKEELTNKDNTTFTKYYDIIDFNPNIFFRGKTHHSEVLLRLIPS